MKVLPKLGFVLNDYVYYVPFEFLFEKGRDVYTFKIKLVGQGQVKFILGRSFFSLYSVVYNNGNGTLNFDSYKDEAPIKKLTFSLTDPSKFSSTDEDWLTPGGWVTLITFVTVFIIIFCYSIKYCGKRIDTDEDDEEEDDIEYEDESIVDDTIE